MDKIALVTGGSRGIGRGIADRLHAEGWQVAITSRSPAGERAQRDFLCLQADNASAEDRERAVQTVLDRFGRIDLLVNNAGIAPRVRADLLEMSEESMRELLGVNLVGPFFLTQRLLPLLQDGGRILNVSSGLARFALPGYAAYAAMKGAMEVLTRYQAKELGGRGISVNIIAPGAIETDFGGGEVRDNAEVNRHIAAQTALGRVGLPDDIGDAIAALLSDELAWMNAQRVEVSGGMFL